jgi:hypothetical protein
VLPLAWAAASAWRLPASPLPSDNLRWERLALGCAAGALVAIVVALRIASPD